jgi:hypothetical protein
MDDHAAKLKQDAQHAEHVITEHLPHRGYHEPQQPAQAQPPEDPMSLDTALKDDVAAVRNGVENAISWLKQVDETHVPSVEAKLAAAQNSSIAQASEAAVLTPAEVTFVTDFINRLPSLRVSEDAEEPAETPDDTSAPADPPQPASGQPVAAGAAT